MLTFVSLKNFCIISDAPLSSMTMMKTKNILHSVSSFVSIKKASGSQGTQKQTIAAVKALPYDQVPIKHHIHMTPNTDAFPKTRWAHLCSHQKPALFRIFSTARRRDPDSQLFWESLLEAVRVLNAKHNARILQLEDDEADLFMCLLQAVRRLPITFR